MQIHGRDVNFRRTVLGNCEIAEICPKKDINKLGDVFTKSDYATAQRAGAKFMVAMSKGYEMTKHYSDSEYVMRPLTEEEVLLLDSDEFNDLFMEAMNAFIADGKTTVQTEAAPSKNADGGGE